MPTVDEVSAKVQRILRAKGFNFEIRDGGYWIPYESTICRISVGEFGDDTTAIDLSSVVVDSVRVTRKLKEYIGERSGEFTIGHLALLDLGRQKEGLVVFRHAIIGDDLDEDELSITLAMVTSTAAELDDELKSIFGGKRAVD